MKILFFFSTNFLSLSIIGVLTHLNLLMRIPLCQYTGDVRKENESMRLQTRLFVLSSKKNFFLFQAVTNTNVKRKMQTIIGQSDISLISTSIL